MFCVTLMSRSKVKKLQVFAMVYHHLWSSRFVCSKVYNLIYAKLVSEYDQEIPQSQTADNPMALQGILQIYCK